MLDWIWFVTPNDNPEGANAFLCYSLKMSKKLTKAKEICKLSQVLAERYNLGSAPNSSSTIKGSAAVAEFTQVAINYIYMIYVFW